MRLLEYIKALAPSKGRHWFLAIVPFVIPAYKQILTQCGVEEHGPTAVQLFMIEAGVAIGVVFVLGFLAWSEERTKNDKEWAGLNFEQRATLTENLKGSNKVPTVQIFNTDTFDCRRLGGDIFHAISAVWDVTPPVVHRALPLPSGFSIQAPPNEARAKILKESLVELGIDAKIEYIADAYFTILVGPKIY